MFETNDTIYIVSKQKGESNKYYFTKCNYLSKQTINSSNFKTHLKNANIHANKTLLNISY